MIYPNPSLDTEEGALKKKELVDWYITQIEEEIEVQLKRLPESSAAHISIKNNGAFVVVDTDDEIVQFCNQFAPEHLCLLSRDPESLIPK